MDGSIDAVLSLLCTTSIDSGKTYYLQLRSNRCGYCELLSDFGKEDHTDSISARCRELPGD
jgi:hypothetical protein